MSHETVLDPEKIQIDFFGSLCKGLGYDMHKNVQHKMY